MRKAFTLVELIVVILIVSFLAYFGIDITLNTYKNYFNTRAINLTETQTEIVLDQIIKRLENRIPASVISRDPSTTDAFVRLSERSAGSVSGDRDNVLEWITYSYESFQVVGWSGFIDIDHPSSISKTNGTLFTTSPELLNIADPYLRDLTNGKVKLSDTNSRAGLMFKGEGTGDVKNEFGFASSGRADSIVKVQATASNILRVYDNADKDKISEIKEQYYLLHTAYAVVPEPVSDGKFDLYLYYNYQPWVNGETYRDGSRALLARDIKGFSYKSIDNTILLQLCMTDSRLPAEGSGDVNIVCKRKAVL